MVLWGGGSLLGHLANYSTQAAEVGSLGPRSRTLGQYTGIFEGLTGFCDSGKALLNRKQSLVKGTLDLGL